MVCTWQTELFLKGKTKTELWLFYYQFVYRVMVGSSM